jgi:hypothetical protein
MVLRLLVFRMRIELDVVYYVIVDCEFRGGRNESFSLLKAIQLNCMKREYLSVSW